MELVFFQKACPSFPPEKENHMNTILGIISFVLILMILVVSHELGHFFFAKLFGVRVEVFSFGFGKELFGFTHKDTRYKFSPIPLGGYVKLKGMFREDSLDGDALAWKKKWQRFLIFFAGPLFNLILMWLCFFAIKIIGDQVLTSKVVVVEAGPAAVAGLHDGDIIQSVNGEGINDWSSSSMIIHDLSTKNQLGLFKVKRGSEQLSFEVMPREFNSIENGQNVKITGFGLRPFGEFARVRHGFVDSVRLASLMYVDVVKMCFQLYDNVKEGKMRARDTLGGPVAIYEVTSTALADGYGQFLMMVALLSFSLAIMNLLPIPQLDGGYIMFLFLETIRGKPLTKSVQMKIQVFFFFVLIALMLLITAKDVGFFGS